MVRIVFYEPSMCCFDGDCGQTVDESLVRLNQNIKYIKSRYPDIEIQRYLINLHPVKFQENAQVQKLVQNFGHSILPITMINDIVVKTGEYPSFEEIDNKLDNKE